MIQFYLPVIVDPKLFRFSATGRELPFAATASKTLCSLMILKMFLARRPQAGDRKSALDHRKGFCQKVSAGLGKLNFEEHQRLLQLVVEWSVIEDNRVRVETMIPTGRDG